MPTYNPTVVYGAWPYPAYPPYYYYPPGYVAGGALLGFTAGVIVGGALWGNCNWGGGDVNVNVNRYNNFNRTNISNGNWNHNAQHRGAVPYRDQGVAQQYGRGQAADAASRDAFRGRAEPGSSRSSAATCRRATRGARSAGQNRDVPARAQAARGGGGRDMSGDAQRARRSTPARGAQTRDYSNRGYVEHEFGALVREHERRRARGGGGGGGGAVAAAAAVVAAVAAADVAAAAGDESVSAETQRDSHGDHDES